MKVQLPYGRTMLECELPEGRVLIPKIDEMKSEKSGTQLVAEAMAKPFGGKTLSELAIGKGSAVIIISDHTRPIPSKDIIPQMLAALREGNPEIDITLLVATGCHRGMTREELVFKLGEEIVEQEKIAMHDARDPEANVQIGVLPSGAPLVIDRLAAETELLVSEGFIEPHFFAGFSGGRKSVLPGICDRVTVLGNHCSSFIDSPYARTGILENNPIHRDMEAAAEMAGLQYIVNVVINGEKETVAAFAGDFREAHAAGVAFLREYCEVEAAPADIVITTNGGAPLDQNLYQCVKGMTAAEASANDGAAIILCADMADGLGGDDFYRDMRDCESPEKLYEIYMNTPQAETVPDQWQTQILCRIMHNYRVVIVTRPEMAQYIRDMKMEYAPDVETAMKLAGEGTLTVIPNGVSVIVKQA